MLLCILGTSLGSVTGATPLFIPLFNIGVGSTGFGIDTSLGSNFGVCSEAGIKKESLLFIF